MTRVVYFKLILNTVSFILRRTTGNYAAFFESFIFFALLPFRFQVNNVHLHPVMVEWWGITSCFYDSAIEIIWGIHQNEKSPPGFCLCSRLIKTDMELEVLRYTNRVSSEAHKMVRCCFGQTEKTIEETTQVHYSLLRLLQSVYKSGLCL